jgi:DNA-binding transcriptional regulator YhcF (GntR family)
MGVRIEVINYLKVYRFIEAYIAAHGYYPSAHETLEHFRISAEDVYRAYNWLRKEGYVELITKHGKVRAKPCR